MEFKSYGHITNDYAPGFVDHCLAAVPTGADWVMTEKIHGSNMSFYIGGPDMIKAARRGDFINPGENFMGAQSHLANYKDAFIRLYHRLNRGPIVVFGESFGGLYPHPKVPTIKNVRPVQKGIYYCPDIKFRAFDIRTGTEYLDWKTSAEACEAEGIPFTKAIQVGPLSTLMEFNVDTFDTMLPQEFGLPPLEKPYPRIAEGIVIRPLRETVLQNGDRVLIKKKSSPFRELTRTHMSEEVKKPGFLHLKEHIPDFINQARLDTVISKQPSKPTQHQERMRLIPHVTADILEEMMREHGLQEGHDKDTIARLITYQVKEFILNKADFS